MKKVCKNKGEQGELKPKVVKGQNKKWGVFGGSRKGKYYNNDIFKYKTNL